ncbi:hypothetical protein [Bradyrhizobium japonicum]|uniref:hypothetical protein n=1 Tax=Bradyrhizobium japonicum TaxID=375 RepID=UPI00200D858D|nr:hypothetical protein [Bradyrhizobium japonicum]UQE01021.1 hypothetical protein JEY30_13165 [Bradyrhizobium japonicum]
MPRVRRLSYARASTLNSIASSSKSVRESQTDLFHIFSCEVRNFIAEPLAAAILPMETVANQTKVDAPRLTPARASASSSATFFCKDNVPGFGFVQHRQFGAAREDLPSGGESKARS